MSNYIELSYLYLLCTVFSTSQHVKRPCPPYPTGFHSITVVSPPHKAISQVSRAMEKRDCLSRAQCKFNDVLYKLMLGIPAFVCKASVR